MTIVSHIADDWGWAIVPDFIAFHAEAGEISFHCHDRVARYTPPTGITFEDIVYGIANCKEPIYRLP